MHSNPIKRRRFYHKICKMFSMGCRRSQTLTPGSCAKCKACKSLSYSTRCQDCSRGSTLRRLLLEQYFIVRKGHLHRITEYPEPEGTQELSNPTLPLHTRVPFCRTPSNLSCSNRAQALLCSDRQHSVFHMTASVCAFTVTSQLADEGVEQYWCSSLPQFRAGDLHPPRFMVWMSAGASDTL